jgi:hypothetical protein
MNDLIIGEKDPSHGKIVKTVAVMTEDFYVFVDNNNEIFYSVQKSNFSYPKDFNKLHSKIRRLEVLVLHNLRKKDQANYNYLLANNLGEAIEETDINASWEELIGIEKDINLLVNDTQKQCFTYGTNISLVIVTISIILFYLNRSFFISVVGQNTFQICFGSLFGGIGALIFNYSKSKMFIVNRIIGKSSNFLEGGLRIFYGVIYALIIILGIKSGMIFNFLKEGNYTLSFIAFIGILAGASDTFIVGVLKAIEKKSIDEQSKNT